MRSAIDPTDTASRHIARRYGAEIAHDPPAWNATLDVLLSHRSVRHYRPDPLPPGLVETLVAAAQSAPSSSNLQTWSVVAITDPDRKARLSVLARDQAFIRGAPLFLVWLVDQQKLRTVARKLEGEAQGLDYFESFLMGAVDTALAAQNATVALEALGLGATYVGAIRNKPAEVAAELALPPHVFALFGMAIGWPDPDAGSEVKPRLPQDAVLFREHYGWDAPQRDVIGDYDARLRAFQVRQAMPEQDWSAQAVARVSGPDRLHGRHALRDILGALGFPLL